MKTLRPVLTFIFIAFIIIPFHSCKAPSAGCKHSEQMKYLPKITGSIYLGMKLEEFRKNKDMPKIQMDEGEFVSYAVEKFSGGNVTEVQYQFDGDKILYEIIVAYNSTTDIKKEFTGKFGPPNDGEEWKFDSKEGFKMKIWVYQNRLCMGDARHF